MQCRTGGGMSVSKMKCPTSFMMLADTMTLTANGNVSPYTYYGAAKPDVPSGWKIISCNATSSSGEPVPARFSYDGNVFVVGKGASARYYVIIAPE